MKYVTLGVCSKEINFDVVENKIKNVSFIRGCDGNLLGISSLVEGMDINEVISRLKGIQCGSKDTSCPDQLARALEIYKTKN
ncbi:TIGR03905 family TSCPD domain-containing protein [Clostridium sp. UBA7503]|uniref:TIGR03905 family TSCPD domain-containing protein n=1 Tax=Clostridium sp. UBA7503 TaxID=1946377 RepID=UPI0032167E01